MTKINADLAASTSTGCMIKNSSSAPKNPGSQEIAVWDPLVRLFHWSLVTAFAVAYLTGDEVVAVHVWAGYAIGGLIVLRVIWGVIGPQHARFSDFVFGPAIVLAYLREMLGFRAKRYLGHSPAGGAMVVLLLVCLTGIVGTGLVTHAIRNHAGPLAGLVSAEAIVTSPTAARDLEERRPPSARGRTPKPGRAWKNVHEFMANLALVLIGLHVAGVLFSSLAHRENLVRAMITGRKPAVRD